jgi:hypothetical protein
MKILIHSLIILAGAGLGLAIGFVWRKPAAPSEKTIEIRSVEVGSTAVGRTQSSFIARRGAIRTDDSPLVTKLERDLSMSSGVTRWLYWLEALERATPADCPRLAQLAQGNSTLVRLVGARWAEMNPQHMFDTLVARQDANFPIGELQRVLLDEWGKQDIDAVIAALSRSDGPGLARSWRRNFAGFLVGKDPERGLPLMSQWNIENYGPQMTGVKKWAAANPRHAAEFALAHPAGYATRSVMETIGKEWARTDPAGALGFAVAHRGEFGSVLASAVLKSWTDRDLDGAANWLAKADAAARNRLSPAFVEGWAKYDAASALKWSESNLTGITFANAAAGLVKGAAAVDLAGAAELVKSMAPSSARAHSAAELIQKWLPDSLSDKPVPPEAIAWLAGLDSQSVNRALEQVQWRWSEADPKGFASFLASLEQDQVPPYAYSILARSMARKNPLDTLAWADQLPKAHRLIAGNDAFSEWQRSQPESARQWLNELPPNDSRRQPFFQNVVSTMVHDPRGAEQLAALTPAEQVTARTLIEKMSISEDRRSALLNVLKPR